MTDNLNEILFYIVVFVANAIQAVTGFAGTLLAMPPSIRLIGVNDAKVILNIITWISCLIISLQNIRYINKKELMKILVYMFLGMIVGIQLFVMLPLSFLLTSYGILVMGIALKNLLIKKTILLPRFLLYLILIAAGIIHGMFVSGGGLLVIYAVSVMKDKREFRATIAPTWVVLNSFLFFDHLNRGYLTKDIVLMILYCILPLFAATYIGNKIHEKINQEVFLKVTYVLLAISGLIIVF